MAGPAHCTRFRSITIIAAGVLGFLYSPAGDAAIASNNGVQEPFSLSVYDTGIGVGVDSNGYVEAFTRFGITYQNSQVFSTSQATGYFSDDDWDPTVAPFLSAYMASDPVVGTNGAGMLDVFFIGPDGNPWHQYQTGYDGEGNSQWSPLPGTLVDGELPSAGAAPMSNVAVGLVGGLLHVYYIGADGAIWEMTQTGAGNEDDWNAPVSLGKAGVATGHPTVIVNGGAITVFYRSDEADPKTGNRGFIYSLTNDGAPTKITGDTGPFTSSNVAPVANSDGRLELFYRGTDDGLWHTWQTSGGGWSTPKQLSETGGTVTSDPIAAINANGLMQVFYRGTEGDIWTVVRTEDNQDAGKWSCRADLVNSMENHVDVAASPLSLAINKKNDPGALQLFYVGGQNMAASGNISRSAVDNGQTGSTLPVSVGPTVYDAWTLVQISAGSNPTCPANDKTGWTTPATTGGLMLETMPSANSYGSDE